MNGGGRVDPKIKIDETLLETMTENFLDDVFGNNSKHSRSEYMETVATKANWIFNAKQVRDKIEKV